MSDRRTFIKQISILTASTLTTSLVSPILGFQQKEILSINNYWNPILELARLAPSPHNIQPWVFKIIDNETLNLCYDPNKLIPLLDIDNRFMTLTMCLVAEYIDIIARNFGFKTTTIFKGELLNSNNKSLQVFSTIKLQKDNSIQPKFSNELIIKRQTSRLAYKKREMPAELMKELNQLATNLKFEIGSTQLESEINWIANLNKDAIFGDMDNNEFREEIKPWLRYSKKEAALKKDGLWSKCMDYPAPLMRSMFQHHEKYVENHRRSLLEKIYLRKSKQCETMMWLNNEFETFDDLKQCGIQFAHIGLIAAKHNHFIHPMGSIITNPTKKNDFIKKMNIKDPDKLWFVFRIGESKTPQKSYRKNLNELIK